MVESLEVETNNSNGNSEELSPYTLDRYGLLCGQLFRILKKHWKCVFAISFLATSIEAILETIYMLATGGFSMYSGYGMYSGTHIHVSHYYSIDKTYGTKQLHFYSNFSNEGVGIGLMILCNALVVYVVACLAKGAVVQTVAELYAIPSQSTTTALAIQNAYETAARKWMPLISTCLCVSLIQFAWGLIVGLLGMPVYHHTDVRFFGVYMAITSLLETFVLLFTNFLIPCVMVEHKGILESVPRAFQLIKGNIGITFAVMFVYENVLRGACGAILSWFHWTVLGSVVGQVFALILTYCVRAFFLAIIPM